MTQLKTPMLAIDRIEIEDGFNARKPMDRAKLERMAGSIEKHELVRTLESRNLIVVVQTPASIREWLQCPSHPVRQWCASPPPRPPETTGGNRK